MKQQGVLTINVTKSHLKLYANNDVKGTLVFDGPFSILDRDDAKTLLRMGFSPDRRDRLTVKMDLTGKRYAAKYLNQSLSKVNTSHTITIYYNDSNVVNTFCFTLKSSTMASIIILQPLKSLMF